jgi:hypothetical protein
MIAPTALSGSHLRSVPAMPLMLRSLSCAVFIGTRQGCALPEAWSSLVLLRTPRTYPTLARTPIPRSDERPVPHGERNRESAEGEVSGPSLFDVFTWIKRATNRWEFSKRGKKYRYVDPSERGNV